jgi:hypothetical protein
MTESQPPSPNYCTIKIHRPSIAELIFFFASGILVGVPMALIFELYASKVTVGPPILMSLLLIVLYGPFIEEFAKIFPLFYRHGETQRSFLTLGFLLGLGFGVAEFFIYVFVMDAPVLLRIPLVIFHACSTLIVAYGITTKHILRYYLAAVGLHMSINLAAFAPRLIWAAGFVVFLSIAYLLAYRLYSRSTERVVE